MKNLKNFFLFFYFGTVGVIYRDNTMIINCNARFAPEHKKYLGFGGLVVGLFVGLFMGLLTSIALLFLWAPAMEIDISELSFNFWTVYYLLCSIPNMIFLSWGRAKNAWRHAKEGYTL